MGGSGDELKRRLPARPWELLGPHAVGSLFLEERSDARRHKHKQADRWRNAGGKNGLLVRRVPPHVVGGAPGLELARRRGFVHRAAAPKLKYVQFELKRMGASPAPDSSTNTFVLLEKVLLYQVVCEAEGDAAPRAGSGRSSNPAAARRGARSPDSPDELSETESSGTESPVGPIPPGGLSSSTDSTGEEEATGWMYEELGQLDNLDGDMSLGLDMPASELPWETAPGAPSLPPIAETAETEPQAARAASQPSSGSKRKLAVIDAGLLAKQGQFSRGPMRKFCLTGLTVFAVAAVLLTEPTPDSAPGTRQLSVLNDTAGWLQSSLIFRDPEDGLMVGEFSWRRFGMRTINVGNELLLPFMLLQSLLSRQFVTVVAQLQRSLLEHWPWPPEPGLAFVPIKRADAAIQVQLGEGCSVWKKVCVLVGGAQMLAMALLIFPAYGGPAILGMGAVKFVYGIWREKALQELQSMPLMLGYRLLGLSCMVLSLELAGVALSLWDQLAPTTTFGELGIIADLPPRAAAVDVGLAVLLCVLSGAVWWERCWLGPLVWLALRLDLAAGDLVARGDWAQWAGGLGGTVEHYGSSLLFTGLTIVGSGLWLRAPRGPAGPPAGKRLEEGGEGEAAGAAAPLAGVRV